MSQAVDSDRLRDEAERILSQPKYRTEATASERFSEWVQSLWLRFLEFLGAVADLVGGPLVFGLILVGLVVVGAVLVTRNLGSRRAREIEARIKKELAKARGEDPADLEHKAEDAARHGDFALAIRQLFRAGLLRLDELGEIRYRPGLTSGEVAGSLGSSDFERLAEQFDQVVYGHRRADSEAYEFARSQWGSLLTSKAGATR